MDMSQAIFNPVRFVFFGLLLMGSLAAAATCGSRVVRFFFLADSFVVGQSRLVCEMPLNNRCVTHYAIRRQDGVVSDFVPFGNEFEHGGLAPGLRFEKSNYGFMYRINGSVERWPFLREQVIIFLLGIVGLLVWVVGGGMQVWRGWIQSFRGKL